MWYRIKPFIALEQFQNNKVMITDYYDDTKNPKLFIWFFQFFWLF